jgi:hypothetical protein
MAFKSHTETPACLGTGRLSALGAGDGLKYNGTVFLCWLWPKPGA